MGLPMHKTETVRPFAAGYIGPTKRLRERFDDSVRSLRRCEDFCRAHEYGKATGSAQHAADTAQSALLDAIVTVDRLHIEAVQLRKALEDIRRMASRGDVNVQPLLLPIRQRANAALGAREG